MAGSWGHLGKALLRSRTGHLFPSKTAASPGHHARQTEAHNQEEYPMQDEPDVTFSGPEVLVFLLAVLALSVPVLIYAVLW